MKLHKCLYLFVSVMVWIHGGGFVQGNGGTDFYGPDFFMSSENPVILVTLNYRLGILGFLSLGWHLYAQVLIWLELHLMDNPTEKEEQRQKLTPTVMTETFKNWNMFIEKFPLLKLLSLLKLLGESSSFTTHKEIWVFG